MYDNTDAEAWKLGSDEAQATVEQRRRGSNADDMYGYLQGTTAQSEELHCFVRWPQSTEIGDFIHNTVRAQEFVVSIEGVLAGQGHICVTVPLFNERMYFLRMRLHQILQRIQSIAEIKHNCDVVAHRSAQRVAIGGFGVLSFW